MGSGLNNISLYQAHTGAWNPNMDANPFDTAFNLTAADVKGLVDQHVDLYASSESEDVRKSCKTEIMLFCFENFDGYCYGSKSFIFNTICVVKFLNAIKRRTSISQLPHECMHYWASTGNMAMINCLRTDDAARFIEYSGTLVREYAMRHSYRYGDQSLTGVLLAKLKLVDLDTGLNELENLQGTDLPFDLDAAKVATVAGMCTRESLTDDIFTWSSGGYSVESVFRLLYQAGYLTPLTPNRVGIPNHDVFEAFVELSEKIYNKSGLPGKFSDHTLERLGLGQGNLIAFAHYLDEIVLQQPPVSSTDMKEKVYHLYMHALLAPLIGVGGFEIDHESQAEGGRMDIRIKPSCSNTSEVRPYIILELKHLSDVRKTRLEEAMTDENLSLVAESALAKCQEAMLQIRQRYQPASNHRAKGSTMFLLIGVTFWRYRFSLIAHQLFSTKTHASRVTWARKPFTEEDISGQFANGVQFSIDDGNLVASNILK
ncbi:hypothetical protein GGI24_001455 [Coemansia furcata]|nr:hypothetical protein GGI24_001455 [Coemansia furcata]